MSSKMVEDKELPRRFELIKKMYFSERVVASSKRDKIIDWFLDQFGNVQNKKNSFKYKLLWETFYDILVQENKATSGGCLLIKSISVQNLIDAVEDFPISNSWAHVILSAISTFLQTSTVNSSLISDINALMKLLIGTVKIITGMYLNECLNQQTLDAGLTVMNNVCEILENLPSADDAQWVPYFTNALKDISLFAYISSLDEPCFQKLKTVSDRLLRRIISCLFNLKTKQFETILSSAAPSADISSVNQNILDFLKTLQHDLNSEENVSSIPISLTSAYLVKRIVHSFYCQNKTSFQTFKIISLFFAVCGLDIPILLGSTSCCKSLFKTKDAKSDVNLLGISTILEECASFPRYFSSVAELEGYVKPSLWLTGVTSSLLGFVTIKNKQDWLKCLQLLVTISPGILDANVVPIIKVALLNLTVKSSVSKKQYCELFCTVLRLHSQMHQLPRFFVKFLLALTECMRADSGNKFILAGQLLPDIEDCLAKSIESYPRFQLTDIWNIFNETFSTFEAITKNFMTTKGYIFLVAQIYSTFLMHAQLFHQNTPTTLEQQIKELIEKTFSELRQHAQVLKETKSVAIPLQRSVLLLSYAIGEVKLAYLSYHDKPFAKDDLPASEHVFDLSVIHRHLDESSAAILESFIHGEDKTLSVLTFQLLLQKLKAYELNVLGEDKKHLVQDTITTILNKLQACQGAIAAWDGDLCSVTDKNYGSVLWRMFLKIFPILMPSWTHKEIWLLCNTAYDLLSDNFLEVEHVVSAFKQELFQESKVFQTAFVSVLWKQERLIKPSKKRSLSDSQDSRPVSDKIFSLLNAFHSKGYKYAERTPKSTKNSGSTWLEMQEISDLMNSLLGSESLPTDKLMVEKIYYFLELFQILPLHYLLPGNQMKCIIGLSYLFFLIPQSCPPAEGLPLSKEIALLLMSIFEGPRSVWLFDFISSGLFIKNVLGTLNFVLSCQEVEFEWVSDFFDHLVHLILKHHDSMTAFKPHLSKVIDLTDGNIATLLFSKEILKKLSKKISHFHKQEATEELLLQMYSETCMIFLENMQKNFKQSLKSSDHYYFISCFIHVIDVICNHGLKDEVKLRKKCLKLLSSTLTVGFEMLTNIEPESQNENLFDAYLLLISKICHHHSEISSHLPCDFESNSWHLIFAFFEKRVLLANKSVIQKDAGSPKDSTAADFNYCSVCFHKYPFLAYLQYKEINGILQKSSIAIPESANQCLKELSSIASEEQLQDVFKCLLKKMGCPNLLDLNVFSFQTFLLVFQCLVNANNEKCQKPLLNGVIQKCLCFLQSVMSNICQSIVCQVMISIPVLEFMSFIVQGKKGIPGFVLYQSLHCVVHVLNEDHMIADYEFFSRMFTASWSVVYNLFMHQTAVILLSPAPFLSFVSKLLKSIIMAGSEVGLSKCSPEALQQMQLCSENMNRLLTVISRHKAEFSKLVPYLVADYVDTIRYVTLEPNMKESILSGLHRLLQLCSEESIKMLAVNLNYVCQEIYANLIKNYRHNKNVDTT